MSLPVTMRALQQMSLNGPQDMRLITDAPVPVPDRNDILIRVVAAGVNFRDISQTYGATSDNPRPARPDRPRCGWPTSEGYGSATHTNIFGSKGGEVGTAGRRVRDHWGSRVNREFRYGATD